MKRTLFAVVLLALAVPALAGVTIEWRVNLVRSGGATVSTVTGATQDAAWTNCRQTAIVLNPREYDCQTMRMHLVVAADPPPPVVPVDCLVSEWSAPAIGEWSTCANSVQTRTTTRSRTVVTPASAGGAACPSITDSTVESRSCTVDPPPPVDPAPTGQVITVSAGQSISNAYAQLQPGGTVLVKPGTYSAFSLKACTAAAWCTVRAEIDGTVIVTGMDWGAGNWYARVEGLKFASSSTKALTGSFVKFFRTSFSGGPPTGNSVTLQIGTNDRTPGASNILLEDSWAYGSGGRYKILVYNSDQVVLRRVVTRHDGGWKYDGQNPQACIAIYDSTNVRAQDVSCLDSAQGLSGFEAALYLVSNGTTSMRAANNVVSGAIVIDSPNNGIAAEGTTSANWLVQDAAVLRSAAGGFNTNGSGKLTVTRAFADVKGAPFAAWNGSLSASSCIYKGGSNSGASLTSCSSTLPTSITQPNALGQGASIQFRIGKDGTLFGEPGFEDLTTAPLWPWPNEERIKADFDAVRPAFGGRSLTGYVQGATP